MWKHSLAHFYFLLFLRFISCCQCNTNQSNETDLYIEKRQLEFEDYSTTELVENVTESSVPVERPTVTSHRLRSIESNETSTEMNESPILETSDGNTEAKETKDNSTETKERNSDFNDSSSEFNESIMDATESNVELNESITSENDTATDVIKKKIKTVKHSHRDLAKKCRHYKKGNSFDLAKMADVWQVVYYQLPNKLKCFKLHIKLVKFKEQQRYATVFGNFNDTVHWDKCFLEIKSSEKSEGGARRHFLQGTQSDKGVMENIIIDEEHCDNTTYLTLHRESGDQWLVIKNLLVMRDCETGDLVVFTKVPLRPRKDDILDALTVFGETKPNGTMACEDKTEKSWIKYVDSGHSHTEEK